MLKFWRNNKWAAALVTVVRIILGYKWITSAWGKVTTGSFGHTIQR